MLSKLQSQQNKIGSNSIENKKDAAMKPNTSKLTTSISTSSTSNDHEVYNKCKTEGCNKSAVSDPEWDNEYCSHFCCYIHCKTMFELWLKNNRAANRNKIVNEKNKTSSIQESVAGPSHQSVSTSEKS